MAKSKNIEQDLDFSESNDWLFGNDVLETRDTNETELFSQKAVKQQFIRRQRKQKFSDILKRLPDNNEAKAFNALQKRYKLDNPIFYINGSEIQL